MGPFCVENCAAACGKCNQMKGARRVASLVFACRHLATKNSEQDFGLYPERFVNNISKRSRSSYITNSSTHTKTHSLTNEQFNEITAKPCFYCGKESSPDTDPPHHNGLDRLDSDNRVYSVDTVVSCCGDCNLMKYVLSVEDFLSHALKVAEKSVGVEFTEDDGVWVEEVEVKTKKKSVKEILRERSEAAASAKAQNSFTGIPPSWMASQEDFEIGFSLSQPGTPPKGNKALGQIAEQDETYSQPMLKKKVRSPIPQPPPKSKIKKTSD